MARITSSEFRRALASCLDRVCMSREPLTVTRRGGHPVVVMPLDEYEGLMETIHLLKSPANADRLLRSIAHADAGRLLFFHDPAAAQNQ